MSYSIQMNPAQSARIVEQAIRHGARLVLEPRIWSPEERLWCTVEGTEHLPATACRGGHSLLALSCTRTVQLPPGVSEQNGPGCTTRSLADRCTELIGTCCHAAILLGENRYLFDSDIIEVTAFAGQEPVRMYLSRPEIVHVAQRRRFRRFQPAKSGRVELRWLSEADTITSTLGWLLNVSGDGLACRVEATVADQLLIDDHVQVEFRLSSDDTDNYVLDAILCAKTPASAPERIILGVQFITDQAHEASARAADTLRHRLLMRFVHVEGAPEEADA
jgi:hypothetical protein